MKEADDWRERSRDCASSRDIFSPPLLGIPVYRVSQRDSTWASWASSMVPSLSSLLLSVRRRGDGEIGDYQLIGRRKRKLIVSLRFW